MVKVMEEIAKHARLGLVSRKELLAKKIDPRALELKVQDGSLTRVIRGIYRLRGVPDSFEARALALTMYAGPKSAVSHFAAAHLHGIEGFDEPATLDVLVPHELQVYPAGARVHRTREKFQIYKLKKLIPITTLARTLVDLSQHLTENKLEIALNSAWRIRRTIASWLRTDLKHIRTDWHGRDVLERLVNRMGVRGLDSTLEVEARQMIEAAGLPAPEKGLVIRDHEKKHVIRGDLAWREQQVLLHLDSSFHASEKAMARDARQRSMLTHLDWTQFIVTRRTIKDRVWLDQIRSALAKRGGLTSQRCR